MAHDKPKDFLETLGPDIKMSAKALEADPHLHTLLRDLGTKATAKQVAQGMEYVGSFAIHIIRTTQAHGAVTGQYDMSSITQIAIDEDCSEQLATLSFNNAVIQLRRWFNPAFKNARRGDNR